MDEIRYSLGIVGCVRLTEDSLLDLESRGIAFVLSERLLAMVYFSMRVLMVIFRHDDEIANALCMYTSIFTLFSIPSYITAFIKASYSFSNSDIHFHSTSTLLHVTRHAPGHTSDTRTYINSHLHSTARTVTGSQFYAQLHRTLAFGSLQPSREVFQVSPRVYSS